MSEQAKLVALQKAIKDAKRNQLLRTATLVLGVILTTILLMLALSFRRLPFLHVAPRYAAIAFVSALTCVGYGLGYAIFRSFSFI
jgi:hypothetical protein